MNIVPLTLAASLFAAAQPNAQAADLDFQGMTVHVEGQGRPVLMIPGLNSAAATWTQTCKALQPVQCHIVQLPGFAGQAPVKTEHFLSDMRARLEAYIADRHLDHPVIVGHSLGGFLALMIGIDQPRLPARLVIVDALPFFPAAANPAATVASSQAMAAGMRQQMLNQPADKYAQGVKASVAGLSNQPAKVAVLADWGLKSDRNTTAEAMYEMMTTDLRPELKAIVAPTLVLGSWAAYKPYGATEDSTRGIFSSQYAGLPGVDIKMSAGGYHFLMWDDGAWLTSQVRGFIADQALANKE